MRRKAAEIAARLYDVWNESGLLAVSERFWHEDIEWRDDPSIPDPGIFRGIDEVRRHIEERVDLLGRFEIVMGEIVEINTERVLAIYKIRGVGGHSAAPYETPIAQLLRFADCKVVEVQDYLDPNRALSELR